VTIQTPGLIKRMVLVSCLLGLLLGAAVFTGLSVGSTGSGFTAVFDSFREDSPAGAML